MKWLLFFAVLGIGVFFVKRGKNNVCKEFTDYYSDRDNNPNCYYNPDHELEVPGIVERYGYPIESYNVTTKDGYILTVFRISHSPSSNETHRKPIYLQHGLTMNAGSFLLMGRKSLGFMLADVGYDVWFGNFRGSRYSQSHIHLKLESKSFWNFSIHELGVYDVQAQTDFVYKTTKQKLIYMGFSLGTTAGYVYGTTNSESAKQKIELFVGVAPVVFFYSSFIKYASSLWPILYHGVDFFTNGYFYPRPPIPKTLYKYLCFPYPIQMKLCQVIDMIILGYNYDQNDPETLPVTLLYNIDSAANKVVNHFIQIANTRSFRHYDYGKEKNQIVYNSSIPPSYDMSKFDIDNFFVFSENDKFSDDEHAKRLYSSFPKHIESSFHKILDNRFNHIDILCGRNADTLVYRPIIEKLKKRLKSKKSINSPES